MRTWRLTAVLLVVPVALFVVAAQESTFHVASAFAGTPERFVAAVAAVGGPDDARRAIVVDLLFVTTWLLVVPWLLHSGRTSWAPPWRAGRAVWRAAPVVAIVAGACDVIEDVGVLAFAGSGSPPEAATLAITTVAWIKSFAFAVAALGLVALVIGPLTARARHWLADSVSNIPDRLVGTRSVDGDAPAGDQPLDGERIGICLSGGGIRAASVAIGALRALDHPDPSGRPSVFRRARWMTAVSGGAYAGGGWRVTRRPGAELDPQPTEERDGLFAVDHPWAKAVAGRHRFLDNGILSLVGGIAGALVRLVAVLGAVLASAVLIGWGVGKVIHTHAVHRWFPYIAHGTAERVQRGDLLAARLVVPWLVPLCVAVVAVVVTFAIRSGRRAPALVAMIAGGYAFAVALLCVIAPSVIYLMPGVFTRVVDGGGANKGAGVIGLLTSLGVVGALVATLKARLKRTWMFLGGWLLAAGLTVLSGKVADSYARGGGGVFNTWHLIGLSLPVPLIAAVWLVAVDAIPSHRLTLGGIYRKRLAATFALRASGNGGTAPLPYGDEPAWSAYRGADGPELIVVATAHATGRRFTGLSAFGFTFRPDAITLYDTPDGSGAAVATADYPKGSWRRGFPRGWVITRSMALTGAAFASAMGRSALGTTQALLAAFNLRLGAWLPNPRHAAWFADPARSPRVHIGYLAKEVLGWYQPHTDPFVYVADGGHRENLGLVELLRERPAVVLVVDASGDRPGSFATLREAVDLAAVELGVTIRIDLTDVRIPAEGLPADCTAEGVIEYPPEMGGGTARLLYGRYQMSRLAPHQLVQFVATDPRFPAYSTGDQYLTDGQFVALVALGEHVGTRLAQRLDG